MSRIPFTRWSLRCGAVAVLDGLLSAAALVLAAATHVDAQPVPLGDEFIVSSETMGFQGEPTVASDGSGSFIVVWSGVGSLRAQRYAEAAPSGTEFQVASSAGFASPPRVAMDADGNFIVTWLESPPAIAARAFDASSQPRGDAFRVDTTIFDYDHGYEHSGAGDEKGPPDAAAKGDGGFFVVWAGGYNEYLYFRHQRRQIMGRGVDETGSPESSDFRVTGNFYYFGLDPALAANAQGQFVVAWSQITHYTYDYGGPDLERLPNYGIRAQQLSSDGVAQSETIAVGSGRGADSAMDGAGNFIVVWGPFAQRYDDEGNAFGSQFDVRSSAFPGAVEQSQVAAAASGSFVVVWAGGVSGEPGGDGSGSGVFARAFARDGKPMGSEIAVNTYTTGAQQAPFVAFTDPDTFVVAWQSYGQDGSDWSVVARRFARAPMCGDASADGKIGASDALAALSTAVAARSCPTCVCDSDASGDVTASDALTILRAAVGIEVTLGCTSC